ncbi:SOS response-associated peptidase [Sphingomonas tabacisoli]|uniref:Abasic site processing protein n=1 Tax=Sphingomonas tabacisoli TaxID=2249466 RepID=A0ABW4HZR6_9SPHN
MCNLYTVKATGAEVAAAFGARKPANFNAAPGEVYPGAPAMVVREEAGERVLQQMTWGFPLRLKTMKPESKPKPVNNIADLDGYMWRFIAHKPEHRCIIPVSGFCEAEGEKGSKTRTWFNLPDRPLFAWAGMWKDSPEWGAVFSGLMTDCNDLVRPVHNRMPVLLHEHELDEWLHGSLDDVRAFQGRCFPPEVMAMDRTAEPWFRRSAANPN